MVRVALTFDAEHPDRPCRPGVAAGILDALATHGLRATFFVQGRWAQAYPGTARAIAEGGHLVGNHSHHHVPLGWLAGTSLGKEVRAAEAAVLEATGIDPRPWLRLPYGRGDGDPAIATAVVALGYRPPVYWDIDTQDWAASSGDDVVSALVDGLRTRTGDTIVLLHTWPDATLMAMPGIVAAIRDGGHEHVRLDALLEVPA